MPKKAKSMEFLRQKGIDDFHKVNVKELLDLYSNLNVFFCIADSSGYFSLINPYWTDVLGWSIEELKSKPFLEFVHPDDKQATADQANNQFNLEESVESFVNRYRTKHGDYRWLEWYAMAPQNGYIYAVASDITDKRERELELNQANDRLKELVQYFPGAFFQYVIQEDATHKIKYVSPGSKDIWGLSPEQIGEDPSCIWDLVLPEDIEPLQASVTESLSSLTQWDQEYRIRLPSGEVRWLRGIGKPRRMESGGTFWNSMVMDTTQLREQQKIIERMAYHDALTGLPNRSLFSDRVRQQILTCQRTNKSFALLFLDVDNFKSINDSLGHSVGDITLKKMTKRLQGTIRNTDTIARISGDEFAIILTSLSSPQWAGDIAKKIHDKFNTPIKADTYDVNVSFSIGISIYPRDGATGDALLKTADVAMYSAKRLGKNNFQFYSPELEAASKERFFIQNELEKALAHNQFELYFQPQISNETPEKVCVEALIRWNHPVRGMIPPKHFIPVAEETRIIVRIGEWVIKEAINHMRDWAKRKINVDRIAINISYIQLNYGDLINTLDEAVQQAELSENKVELEITESAFLKDISKSQLILNILKSKGYRLAMDDFGVGHSSLSQLKRLPFDKVKIDKSFIDDLNYEDGSNVVTCSIIHLAKSLGLDVIAEGVESQKQEAFLRQNGCHELQGYLFGRPLPKYEFESWLDNFKDSNFSSSMY
ncbi:MAG: EAL domain-containing protein [Pseudomonadota bacterium]